MSIHHETCITGVAATVCSLLGVPAEPGMAEPIPQVLTAAPGTGCERVFLYNPDAIAAWVTEQNREVFEPLEQEGMIKLPMRSVVPPVTPVCFGSMYSGLLPGQYGIQKYEKPVLQCPTLFDALPKAGKRVAIVSTAKDSISLIFLQRPVDYYIYPGKEECNRKALELIRQDEYDCIVLYNGDYDHYMHRCSPEGKRALRALKENVQTWYELREEIRRSWAGHRAALVFAPDHGCHRTLGFFGTHGEDRPCDMNIYHYWSFIPGTKA